MDNCKIRFFLIKNPCGTCNGKKRVNKQRTIAVNIPAGIATGNRIRLSNEGEAGMDGGPSGDLFVEVEVKEHAIFKRVNHDLHCEIPISFTQACLGASIKAPTIDGEVTIKIPAETQTGASFRLRGKGVKGIRSSIAGDLICKVHIETPVKLDKKQRLQLYLYLSAEIILLSLQNKLYDIVYNYFYEKKIGRNEFEKTHALFLLDKLSFNDEIKNNSNFVINGP